MNSFIYRDQDLLGKLFSIAQQQSEPVIRSDQMYAAALQAIQNARTQYSTLKADRNPTFNDIQNLEYFKTWAVEHRAVDAGKPLVDMSGNFNSDVLQKFLTDLQSRVANNPTFSEGIAGLIEEANKTQNLKIPVYSHEQTTREQTAAGEKLTPAPGGSHLQVADKITGDPNAKEENNQKAQTVPQANQQNNPQIGSPPDMNLLVSGSLDLMEINNKAREITNYTYKLPDRKTYDRLQASVRSIYNNFQTHQQHAIKSSGIHEIVIQPGEDFFPLHNTIEKTYQDAANPKYVSQELYSITASYISMMNSVIGFYTSLKSDNSLKQFSSEFDVQIKMANQYEYALNGALGIFKSDISSTPR